MLTLQPLNPWTSTTGFSPTMNKVQESTHTHFAPCCISRNVGMLLRPNAPHRLYFTPCLLNQHKVKVSVNSLWSFDKFTHCRRWPRDGDRMQRMTAGARQQYGAVAQHKWIMYNTGRRADLQCSQPHSRTLVNIVLRKLFRFMWFGGLCWLQVSSYPRKRCCILFYRPTQSKKQAFSSGKSFASEMRWLWVRNGEIDEKLNVWQ